jgi:hypothetical protein
MTISAALRQAVRDRASERCEYCRLPQQAIDGVLQIEHIIARQHLGDDSDDNLALACDQCNLHKGPNLSGLDPNTGQLVALFHPRRDHWDEHFELQGAEIVGRTSNGRATARLLQMNGRVRLHLRALLITLGEW